MTQNYIIFALWVLWAIILIFLAIPMAIYTLTNGKLFCKYTESISEKVEVIYEPILKPIRAIRTNHNKWLSDIRGAKISSLQVQEKEIDKQIRRIRIDEAQKRRADRKA